MRWEFPTKKTHTPSIFLRGWFLWHFSCYHSFIPLLRCCNISQCEDKIWIFGFWIQVTIGRLWAEWASNHTPNFYICLYLTYQRWMKSNVTLNECFLTCWYSSTQPSPRLSKTLVQYFFSFSLFVCLFMFQTKPTEWWINLV